MSYCELFDRLNIKTKDFVCFIGHSDRNGLLSRLAKTVKGIVVCDRGELKADSSNDERLRDVKFVESAQDLDESAYDKLVCQFDDDLLAGREFEVMSKLMTFVDNKGMILIDEIPRYDASDDYGYAIEFFTRWLYNQAVYNYWVIEEDRDTFSLLFEVKKY